MTDEELIAKWEQASALSHDSLPEWNRLLALARRGAAMQKLFKPQKSLVFNEVALGKDETRILYENLSQLYLEQKP